MPPRCFSSIPIFSQTPRRQTGTPWSFHVPVSETEANRLFLSIHDFRTRSFPQHSDLNHVSNRFRAGSWHPGSHFQSGFLSWCRNSLIREVLDRRESADRQTLIHHKRETPPSPRPCSHSTRKINIRDCLVWEDGSG